jgi:hypothetical protein
LIPNKLAINMVGTVDVTNRQVLCASGSAHQENTIVNSCGFFQLYLLAKFCNFSSFLLHHLISDSQPGSCQIKDLPLRGADERGHIPEVAGADEYQSHTGTKKNTFPSLMIH